MANAEIVRKMFTDGRLGEGDIRIIWTIPPCADNVWAMHPRFAIQIVSLCKVRFYPRVAILSTLATRR